MKKMNKVSVPKLLGAAVLVVIVGVGLLSFWPSAEKKLFLSRLETAMEQGKQTIRMDELISEDFDTICVVVGDEAEFDQIIDDMKQFKNFKKIEGVLKRNRMDSDSYRVYLLKDGKYKAWFRIWMNLSFSNVGYSLVFYSQTNTCFSVSQYSLNRQSARNIEVLTLSRDRRGN